MNNVKQLQLIVILIVSFLMMSCNEKRNKLEKERSETLESIANDTTISFSKPKLEVKDSVKINIIPEPQLPEIVNFITIPAISCFNPNLQMEDAIQLINSGIKDTQWFVIEKRSVNHQHVTIDATDTIFLKKELLLLKWKLIDSSRITIGNLNNVIMKLEKDNRVCTIEKKLYLTNTKENNLMEEWFEIREKK